MRSSLTFYAVTALVVAATSAYALESSMTVRSPLSPGELWNKVGDFCAMSEWDPAVELCDLSADGKRRTTVFFGVVVSVVAALDDWDEVNRSYNRS
ncbi:SRPBCC family protein [Bradyrhizobium sp. sGM-13]|uniref:SRPBCC family protein n=1 Tax=Bradyrhizobium sp. sGM-13 TaxID=2831781 RepID=UPI0035C797C6